MNALGVGHPAIDKVCRLATSLGLNAKLTGGGGGGCVIAILPFGKIRIKSMLYSRLLRANYSSDISDAKLVEFKSCFEGAGFECWETSIACGGVCAHSVI